ncbi:acetolactate decarboxylase [Priestia flexa]|uniref:acetolactate decarboxylase n=1 Tax=Priestia flexa TaxID=86664 RepID=UPI00099B938D|nr:acetolactate decarboxylase [Priestia flexa]AQX56337.1 alpha-acetolactate decarboxylase [Priestia flexa]
MSSIIYQKSTMVALLEGVYDGIMTKEELSQKGDFGLGTFQALDGEMLAVDGGFYHLREGKAVEVEAKDVLPFAVMTYFKGQTEMILDDVLTQKELEQQLEAQMSSENVFYAIKIEGVFKQVKTRTVAKQRKPYPPMTEVAESQPVFELEDVKGTMVGFFTPNYVAGVGIPGYHFHFIDEHKTAGGHVLDVTVQDVKVILEEKTFLELDLDDTQRFRNANLDKENIREEIEEVE